MKKPANIDGKLMRFGTWQKHAVIKGMQKSVFADPPLFLDDNPMHYGNLACRTAEAQCRHSRPYTQCLAERNSMVRSRWWRLDTGLVHRHVHY